MDIKEQIEQQEKRIERAYEVIKDAKETISEIRSKCSHADLKINNWGSADCNICKAHFSWYCPTSPTLECDYEQEDGSYDEDSCRYCGHPEERK